MLFTAVNPKNIREHWQKEYTVHCVKLNVAHEVVPDQVELDHSLQHSTSVLHRKSGTLEHGGSVVRSSVQVTSFIAKNHTKNRLEKKKGELILQMKKRENQASILASTGKPVARKV